MNAPSLQALEITTNDHPNGSIIWLHGLGASGYDFEPIVPELNLPSRLAIRFIFPHAPSRPVTLNGGLTMPSWFDVYTLEMGTREDEMGIRQAARCIEQLIEREEKRGIGCKRIVLAGFSQGGAIALHTGIRYARKLAGIIALSCFIPLPNLLAKELNPINHALPLFMAHGTFDQTVLYEFGAKSRDMLIDLNYSVEWHDYPIAHGVCHEEIKDIGNWLTRVIP